MLGPIFQLLVSAARLADTVNGLDGLAAGDDESTSTGNVVVSPSNAWATRAVRKLGPAQVQAVIEALVLAVRYDGTVTRAEATALNEEVAELAQARGTAGEALAAMVAQAAQRVDAMLASASPREDAARARARGAERVAQLVAAQLTDLRVRVIVFRTVTRIARGSSGNDAAAEELLAIFGAAFGLEVPET